jgi:hypothetical protein
MSGMTSPTSIRIGPMGQFDPRAPMFSGDGGEANKILGSYGLQMPQISPDPVFQNSQNGDGSFLGDHPLIRSMISGGIMGGAFTQPSRTPGEAISNIAQGILGGQNFTRERALQQFMAPFNVANTLSEVQGRQGQLDYLHGLGKFYGSRADNQRQVLATHQTVDGKMFNVMESGETEWIKDPNGNILVGPPTPSQRPAAGQHPGGLAGQIVESMIGPPPADPTQAPEWGQRAAQIYAHLQGQSAGARTSGEQSAHEADPHYVPPDQSRRISLYATQAKDDIKATQKQLEEAMKKPRFNMKLIPQIQEQLNQKKSAYGGYAAKLLDGEDVSWDDYLKQATMPQTNNAPAHVEGNPFVR